MIEPPFIADFVAFLLLLALLYILAYSIYLRKNPSKIMSPQNLNITSNNQYQKVDSAPPPTPPQAYRSMYFIEPPPVPGQTTPFPSIFYNSSELIDISVVVAVDPNESAITSISHVLEDISIFFSQDTKYSKIQYEVIIVDNNANCKDAFEFALRNPEFRILRLPLHYPYHSAVIAGCTHSRGRLIFIFSAFEGVPFSEFSKYMEKAKSGAKYGPNTIVVGSWKKRDNEEDVFRTTLSLCIDAFVNWLSDRFLDLKKSAYRRCGSFLLTRSAAVIVSYNLNLVGSTLDYEMLPIADVAKITVKVANLDETDDAVVSKKSLAKADDALTFLVSILFYKLNIWKIQHRIPKQRQNEL